MIFEYDHTVRRIYTDGRPLPKDPDPLWLGYSVGRWEGNTTFVVDTVGFNENTWLDRLGVPHSDQLHVTERFHRVDGDHLQLDVTMQDPKALAKPWTGTLYYELRNDWGVAERLDLRRRLPGLEQLRKFQLQKNRGTQLRVEGSLCKARVTSKSRSEPPTLLLRSSGNSTPQGIPCDWLLQL